MSSNEQVLYSVDGHIAEIRLNSADTLNSLDEDMHEAMLDALLKVRTNPEVRAVVFCAEGKAFSAGGNLDELKKLHDEPAKRKRMTDVGLRLIDTLIDVPVPIVVALQGDAIGLGASLALSGDIIVASKNARLADTHVKVGLVAGDGGCLTWPMSMGLHRAKRYLLTGKMLPAEKAYEFGVVTDLVDTPEETLPLAREIAADIASMAPLAITGTKKALNQLSKARANEVFPISMAYEEMCLSSDDILEALAAFKERRKPEYQGK